MSQEQRDIEDLQESDDEVSTRIDAGITIAILLGAVFFLLRSRQISGGTISAFDPGAAFWPQAVLIVIVIGGLINLWLIYDRARNHEDSSTEEAGAGWSVSEIGMETFSDASGRQKQFFGAVVSSLAYLVLLTPVGFLVLTPLYLFALGWVLQYNSLPKLAAFSVVTPIVLFLVFNNLMNILLPSGTGIFRQITVFFGGLL